MIKTAESLERVHTHTHTHTHTSNLLNECKINKIDKNRQEYCVCIKNTE